MRTALTLAALTLLCGCATTPPAPAAPQAPAPAAAAAPAPAPPAAPATEEISGEHARTLVTQGALLLDVRGPDEYAQGHLAGAQNLPLPALQAGTLPTAALDAPVVLYCKSGKRSAEAARLLREAGFQDVHVLGAMEKGAAALGTARQP